MESEEYPNTTDNNGNEYHELVQNQDATEDDVSKYGHIANRNDSHMEMVKEKDAGINKISNKIYNGNKLKDNQNKDNTYDNIRIPFDYQQKKECEIKEQTCIN